MPIWTCDYDGLACRCLPLADCFAREGAWRFQLSTDDGNFHRKRRSHLSAHEEHESQADLLLEVADRVQRCDPRGWRCACGETLSKVSAVLGHECPSERSLTLPVRATLRKCHPALQPHATPQVQALPALPAPLAAKLSSYNEAAASLAMATVDNLCNESLLLPLQPAKRCLQLGDFFPHPDTKDAFCCVYSLHMVQLWWLICIHFLAKATADSILVDLVVGAFLPPLHTLVGCHLCSSRNLC